MSEQYSVVNTPVFRLKDKPNRQYQAINLEKQFGFIPKVIIVEKVQGHNNAIIIRAVVEKKVVSGEKAL